MKSSVTELVLSVLSGAALQSRGGYHSWIWGDCMYKSGWLSVRYPQRKCLSVYFFVWYGYFCVHLNIPAHCLFICGKWPSLSQEMSFYLPGSRRGRAQAIGPAGSSVFCDWEPWSTGFLRKAGDGSGTSFLQVPLFQFPRFGRTEPDFFSHGCYGLQRIALKLALRRWKGRESSL